jgi:hypothetical protein
MLVPSTPTTHFDKVDEETSDGDTTTVGTGDETTQRVDRYSKSTLGLPPNSTIDSLTVYAIAKKVPDPTWPTTPSLYLGFASGGGDTFGASETLTTSYSTFSKTWTVDPATTQPWLEATIDALLMAVKAASNRILKFGIYYYSYTVITKVWIVVAYTVGAGPAQSMLVQVM